MISLALKCAVYSHRDDHYGDQELSRYQDMCCKFQQIRWWQKTFCHHLICWTVIICHFLSFSCYFNRFPAMLYQERNQEVHNIYYCLDPVKLIWYQKPRFAFQHSKIISIFPSQVGKILSLLTYVFYLLLWPITPFLYIIKIENLEKNEFSSSPIRIIYLF